MFEATLGEKPKLSAQWVSQALRRRSRGNPDPYKDPEGIVERPDAYSVHASTEILCKDIADKLVKHYPGWQWAVQPDERGRIINIFCWNLHDEWGYTIRLVDLIYDPRRREAIRAGGEILRRFRVRPGPLNGEALADVVWEPGKRRAIPILDDQVASRQQMARHKLQQAHVEGRVKYQVVNDEVYAEVKE